MADGLDELADRDRLRQIGLATALPNALFVALHRKGGDRDDGNAAQFLIVLEPFGDIQLPEVSGLEVTKWLKDDSELKRIPVVAVTAFAMKGDEERIREGGCEAYLSKPISVGKFIETVRHFLGNPEAKP